MNGKRWFWVGSLIAGIFVLLGLLGSVTQTAMMQDDDIVSRRTAVTQQGQVKEVNQGGDTAVNITAVNALIPDGSFENNPSLWTEWDSYGCNYSSIDDWTFITGFPARHGLNYFWAGGRCDEQSGPISNYAEQRITIPTDNPALSFWYISHNTEDNATNEDYAYVELFDDQTETYYTAWQLTMSPATNTNGWVRASVDLTPFAGRDMTLQVGGINYGSGDVEAFAGSMFFDLFEFSDPPPTTSEIDGSGGFLQYTDPYTGSPVTDINVPSGAVRTRTVMQYTPAGEPGFPLDPVPSGESPLGAAKLSYAGIAFDLEAYDEFVYLPLVVNSVGNSPAASDQTVTEIAAPDAVEAPHSFQFNQPLKVTIYYDQNKLDELGISEEDVYLYYWTGDGWADAASTCEENKWIAPSGYNRFPDNDYFELHVCHFSRFGTVGVN